MQQIETTKGSSQTAPFFIQSLLFPVTMLAVVLITHQLIAQGLEIPLVLALVTFGGFFVVAASERLWPLHAQWNDNRQKDFQTDLLHFIHNGFWVRLCETGVRVAAAWLAIVLAQYSDVSLWPHHWHWSAQFMLGMVLGESVEYWVHRLQHEVPWFWRFHAVHHSAPRLYWLNAVRFHPIDVVCSAVGRLLPVIVLGVDESIIAMLTVFSGVHATFQHCNIPMRIGPLNWIFSMAELHRWHHSKKIEESNTNYGGDLIFWDILCGTRFLPKDREPPVEIGMESLPHFPMNFLTQIRTPFRWKKTLEESQ